MNAPKIFTPEYYELMRENEASAWWNAGMRDAALRLLSGVDLPAAGTMLDIGCGSGQSMSWFREHWPGWSTIGLDVAVEGLVAARVLGETDVFKASALELPLPDACVDAVITLDVLQHLPLPDGDRAAMNEIARVLRPGGHAFIRTNAQAFPHTPDDYEYDFHKYEPHELRAKLGEAGFEVVRLSRLNGLLGLAEIPRELRARDEMGEGYHGILSDRPAPRDPLAGIKRRWLGIESRAVSWGLRLPIGRTIVALCRRSS